MLSSKYLLPCLASMALLAQQALAAPKLAVAHFMVSATYAYDVDQWTTDMLAARQMNLDGFVLNFPQPVDTCETGVDNTWYLKRIQDADTAAKALIAAGNDFKLMFSFDMDNACYWTQSMIEGIIAPYASSPAWIRWGSKNSMVLSTFGGDSPTHTQYASSSMFKDVSASSGAIWAPALNYQTENDQASNIKTNFPWISGFVNWNAWPHQGAQPLNTTDFDGIDALFRESITAQGTEAGPYIYTASPTQFKYGIWGKWTVFADYLFPQRLEALTSGAVQADIVQLISWNDFPESHYLRSIATIGEKTDKGDYCVLQDVGYVSGHNHDAWRTLAKYYLGWWKSGVKPHATMNQVVYWYRTTPKQPCSSQVPGAEDLTDGVIAWALTKDASTINLSFNGDASSISFETTAQGTGLATLGFPGMRDGSVTPKVTITPKDKASVTCQGSLPIVLNDNCASVNYNPVVNLCGGGINSGSPAAPVATAYGR